MSGSEWRPELLTTIAAPAIWAYFFRIVICVGFVGAAIAKMIQFDASVAEFSGQYKLKHPRTLLVVYIAVALLGSILPHRLCACWGETSVLTLSRKPGVKLGSALTAIRSP